MRQAKGGDGEGGRGGRSKGFGTQAHRAAVARAAGSSSSFLALICFWSLAESK